MSWLEMSEIALMLQAKLQGSDKLVEQVSTDTRKLPSNSVFFALQGPNFDAHNMLDEQTDLPVAGVVVAREVNHSAPAVVVDDTLVALQQFALAWRSTFTGELVGLTGSNGKTTVKEMIAAIFAEDGNVFATKGNLNNEIGVPLSLLEIRAKHRRAVIEMGANHSGEISLLTALARPDIALITNAGSAHLEGFGTREGVAHAKGEIFSGLSEDGIAIINADDDYADYWRSLNPDNRVITFGTSENADCRLLSSNPLQLSIGGQRLEVDFHLLGEHNAMNAAAAAAVAMAADLSLKQIADGLASVTPVSGRLCRATGAHGETVIDDSYNANPSSVAAAIRTLAEFTGRRFLVLGDLGELGPDADQLHAEIGQQALDAQLDGCFTLGAQARLAAQSFGANATATDSMDELLAALTPVLAEDAVILVKGSRTSRMERVVQALLAAGNDDDSMEVSHAS